MASTPTPTPEPATSAVVVEPVAIYKLAHRYLVYDVHVASHLRRQHHISGVLIGSLPQASQQNVFLGLPLELMPEEARWLVAHGVAHVVDDVAAHKSHFLSGSGGSTANGAEGGGAGGGAAGLSADERRAYQAALRKQGQAAAADASKRSDDRKKAALKKLEAAAAATATATVENWNDLPEDMLSQPVARRGPKKRAERPARDGSQPGLSSEADTAAAAAAAEEGDSDDLLFASSAAASTTTTASTTGGSGGPPKSRRTRVYADSGSSTPEPYAVTPTTSSLPLWSSSLPPSSSSSKTAAGSDANQIPVPRSYPVYRYLHEKGYFLAPGLRFGCQYMAYPGDPLRFHSHFLCNGMEWDEEFDLIDLIGGGRLGTGVKKGYLIGGEQADVPGTRTFCVEWAGM